jgi:ectoine hydroxylase-related dioxygenase (phytanoyl-CoA dioxygenase family)
MDSAFSGGDPMFLDQSHAEQFHRDGYLIVPDVFTPDEVAAMLEAVETGSRVAGTTVTTQDTAGRPSKLAIWFELGDDIWSAVSTCPRLVNGIRILLGEEIAFFHGKVILKEARQGGAWEWHQDYGYWYDQGFAFPRLLSASIALDPATRQNGCLEVLRGSHKLGRVTHGRFGTQTGIDPSRMKALEPLFDRVHCEMKPGSVLFFHCNLLHSSAPNLSERPRRSVIMCYNALANPQINVGYEDNHNLKVRAEARACPVSADDAILKAAAMV